MFRIFLNYIKSSKIAVVKNAYVSLKTLTCIACCLTVFCICVGSSKEGGAGAVDEDDFIKAFTDVPTVQVRCCIYLCLFSETHYLQSYMLGYF